MEAFSKDREQFERKARRLAEKGVRRADFFFGRGARIDIQLSNWRRFNSCCSAATGTLDLGWTGEGFCLRAEERSARPAQFHWALWRRAMISSHVFTGLGDLGSRARRGKLFRAAALNIRIVAPPKH
jgi:hypothetical protein